MLRLTSIGLSLLFLSIATKVVAQPYPILFVTQVPIPADFATIGATFANHKASMKRAGRGGDLWIKYTDGSFKNLTQSAGYGMTGMQGANSIAVRDPAVHWSGNKAVFSMVVGAPVKRYSQNDYRWQLYEITGILQGQTPVITKVANQPTLHNNVSPIYGTDDRIIFTSDRPRNGQAHLYPQLDEYEATPTNTGLWSLNPPTGELKILNHAPSGNFTPLLDSFGRVIFTQWDHLRQDPRDTSDGAFNFASEAASAPPLFNNSSQVFPEPKDRQAGSSILGHNFNQFMPWQMNEDGTGVLTINHIGRHELKGFVPKSQDNDPNVRGLFGTKTRLNGNFIDDVFQLAEDPLTPGRYYATDAPKFRSHSSGQIIRFDAPTGMSSDDIKITYITHRDTSNISDSPSANHTGLYRDPLPISDGNVIVTHTTETRQDQNEGSRSNPRSRYDFRLKSLVAAGNGFYKGGTDLTPGDNKTISYWDPDQLVTFTGRLWEWNAVEVRPRAIPAKRVSEVRSPEKKMFDQANVDVDTFKAYLKSKNLALVVSRDVTTRDDLDQQQPFNLRVKGTNKQTLGKGGKVYDVADFQFFQADQIRARRSGNDIKEGRRVIPQIMHDVNALHINPYNHNGIDGSVAIAKDGSMAAYVPAGRAMTWQMTNGDTSIVRERNWLTFQPGEIVTCPACHGVNDKDQSGADSPTNPPKALAKLLEHWKSTQSVEFVSNDFDDDNISDVLWRNSTDGSVHLFGINAAKVQHSVPVIQVADQNWQITGTGDFNNDSHADMLWRNIATGENWMLLMDGNRIIHSGPVFRPVEMSWEVKAIADFDADGKSDILWRNKNSGQNWLLFMDGPKVKRDHEVMQVADTNWQLAGCGDFNKDGYPDLVWRNAATGLNWMLLMQEENIISSQRINQVADMAWKVESVEDFDGDGKADILWRNKNNGLIWVYVMDENRIRISTALAQIADNNLEIVDTGDYNHDQKADIFWRHKLTGENFFYLITDEGLASKREITRVADPAWKVMKHQ